MLFVVVLSRSKVCISCGILTLYYQIVYMIVGTEPQGQTMKWNDQIRHERKSREWSQSLVAERIGTSPFTVNRWERGHAFPSPFYREQLSELFGKSLEELGLTRVLQEVGSSGSKKSQFLSDLEYMHNEHQTSKNLLISENGHQASKNLLVSENEHHASKNLLISENEAHPEPLLQGGPPQPRKHLPPTLWLAFALSGIALLALIPYVFVPSRSPSSTKPMKSSSTTPFPSLTAKVTPAAMASSGSYEAEAPGNTRDGTRTFSCNLCFGGVRVGWIRYNVFLQFNNVNVNHDGDYTLTIYYLNTIANRVTSAFVSVNGGPNAIVPGLQVAYRSCCNNFPPQVTQMTVHLHAGNNTINISNPTGYAPDIDRIVVG